MKDILVKSWQHIIDRLLPGEQVVTGRVPGLLELIEEAREDWQSARAYFDTVNEPELVDHAIYLVEATEKKYTYLLKKARQQNLCMSPAGMAAGRGRAVPYTGRQA